MSKGPPPSPRSADIVAYRQANPTLTLQAIGVRYGVTRERVRQILRRGGLPTRRPPPPMRFCKACSLPLNRDAARFCSTACWSVSLRITLTCEECGTLFKRRAADHAYRLRCGQRHIWCGKRCSGLWLGRTFGFARLTPRPALVKAG